MVKAARSLTEGWQNDSAAIDTICLHGDTPGSGRHLPVRSNHRCKIAGIRAKTFERPSRLVLNPLGPKRKTAPRGTLFFSFQLNGKVVVSPSGFEPETY